MRSTYLAAMERCEQLIGRAQSNPPARHGDDRRHRGELLGRVGAQVRHGRLHVRVVERQARQGSPNASRHPRLIAANRAFRVRALLR